MMQRNQPFHNWKAFTRAVELDFGPSVYDCPQATLFKLAQTGSVNDYYMEFTSLANRVNGLTPDAVMDCFISGLNLDLQREVMSHCPISLLKTVALARLFEEKFQPPQKNHSYSANPHPYPSQNRAIPTTTNVTIPNTTRQHPRNCHPCYQPQTPNHSPNQTDHPTFAILAQLKCNFAETRDCVFIVMRNFHSTKMCQQTFTATTN